MNSISSACYLHLFLNISSSIFNFGWHRITRIKIWRFMLKYQLQKAYIDNVSGLGLNGHGLPRNLFYFSCSLVWTRFIKQPFKRIVPFPYLLLLVGANLRLFPLHEGPVSPVIDELSGKGFEFYKPALLGIILPGKKREKKRLFFTFQLHCLLFPSFSFPLLFYPSSWSSPWFSVLLCEVRIEKVKCARCR